eukprot:m.219347 g.219347  ORF g.219347 m.219347 type:complete len:385 (+) comp26284_c0_seq1:9474-10628(+)
MPRIYVLRESMCFQPQHNKKTQNEVVLKGFSSTSLEYLLRGIGMVSWCTYNWNDPTHIITTVNDAQVSAILKYLTAAKTKSSIPFVRVPLTASSWLNVKTKASSANMDKYPNLYLQYQSLVKSLVHNFTSAGVVTILDLHWNDDDTEQQPMALTSRPDGGPTGNAVDFWDQVAQTFSDNDFVFYELYNEPHTDANTWMNGDGQHFVGMLELLATVRKHTATGMCVIAGAQAYAYDADSLVQLEPKLQAMNERNVLFNFHPYMGPNQAGALNKCAAGFEQMVQTIHNNTDKPVISTEFGQACCATNGPCESCKPIIPNVGYDEEIILISERYNASWSPWAWRPEATGGSGPSCFDLNGGDSTGTALAHATGGKGADWATLWPKYT